MIVERPLPALREVANPAFLSRPRRALPALAIAVASVVLLTAPATQASPERPPTPTTRVESWTGPSAVFRPGTPLTRMSVVPVRGAVDGSALELRLPAFPEPGPSGGALIKSTRLYRYGRFGTRMRTADCTGQDHPGVLTGTFTYASDHSDANRNGITDNDEIDIEILCGQPEVVYLSIWTDYSETANALREISRAINLRTGAVLSNCYIVSYGSGCRPGLPGENSPAVLPPIPGFDSATQFHSYSFDWQPDHVTFATTDNSGHPVVLWDYRGPRSRIPAKPSALMQNVTHTTVWDPLNGPAHNQPTADTSAYIDSTFAPS